MKHSRLFNHRHDESLSQGFTILELLIVVAIIGILAGLLLPVFAKAKADAKRTVCFQNLRSLYVAATLYQGDADDLYPFASNPSIRDPLCATGFPHYLSSGLCETSDIVPTLNPYIRGSEVWHCPLDSGLDFTDLLLDPSSQHPTSYASTGSSYWYNDELSTSRHSGTDLFDATKAVVFADRTGAWHGSGQRMRPLSYNNLKALYMGYRYQAVHGDGHVKALTGRQMNFGLGAASCNCRWYDAYQSFL